MSKTQQPEALRLATASNAMADEGEMIHLLSWHEIRNLLRANAAELRRLHTENETLRVERERNLNSIRVCNEIINKKNAELESLTTGYAAARLEIESLQARIKTMAEEHADELMVAHLDGRMRAAQPAGGYPALPSNAFNIDPGSGGNIRGYSADQMRAYADATCAMRAVQPAGAQQSGDERAAFEQWSKVTNQGYDLARNVSGKLQTFESTETEHAWRGFFHGLRASHGQAPAQEAPARPACKPDMLVNAGALKLALNVLHRAGKHEVADELEKTAQAAPAMREAVAGPSVDDMARILFAAWSAAEPAHSITQNPTSYAATFADMARAALAAAPATQPAPQREPIKKGGEA